MCPATIGATTSHQQWLALGYRAGTLAISLPAATWLFPHHTAA